MSPCYLCIAVSELNNLLVVRWHVHGSQSLLDRISNSLCISVQKDTIDNFLVLLVCAAKLIVGMADVEAAIKEMFQAPHIQVSWIKFFLSDHINELPLSIILQLELITLHFYYCLQMIRTSSKLSKIFLAAMVHELYKTGMGETTFDKVAYLCTRVISV